MNLPDAKITRDPGLDVTVDLPAGSKFSPAIMVRATFDDKEPVLGNPESLGAYDRFVPKSILLTGIMLRTLLTLHAGPMTGRVPVKAGQHEAFQRFVARMVAEGNCYALIKALVATGTEEQSTLAETMLASGMAPPAILAALNLLPQGV